MLSIVLDLRRPETGQPMPFDLATPDQELVDRQIVALAGVIEAQKSTAHRGDNFRLSPDHPPFGIRDGQHTTVGSKDATKPGTVHFGHSTLTHDQDLGAL